MREGGGLGRDQLWKVLGLTRRLGVPVDLDEMLAGVIEVGREVVCAERATVFLYDRETDELVSRVGTGLSAREVRFPAAEGIAGACARARATVNVPDAYADPRFNSGVDRELGFRTRSLLAVPLVGLDDRLVGVLQLLNRETGPFTPEDARAAEVLGAQCATALQRAVLMEERFVKEKMERDLALARSIQRRLLPEVMPELSGYELAGWNEPADQTGGDIFDAALMPDGSLYLLLADACGHGVGPALSVTQLRSMVRMGLRVGEGLDAVFAAANAQLVDDLAGEHFITAFAGLLDPVGHTISYHAFGQGPMLHVRADGSGVERLPASTIPLGIMPDIPLPPPESVRMQPGDLFCLVSDGLFEQENREGEQFGIGSMEELLATGAGMAPDRLAVIVAERVMEHAGEVPREDDMTLVLVRRKRAGRA